MPNVPNLPGVPPLSSYSVEQFVFLVADAVLSLLGFGSDVWGIFLAGADAVQANSVVRFDFRQDWTISDYQVEQGAFQSYDKVQLPFDVRLRIASGPTIAERQAMIDDLDVVGNSTELYDVVTPEKVYTSVNCAHVDYARTSTNGAGMIVADVWFTEVREEAEQQFSNTQQPQEAGAQNAGNVQPQSPPSSIFAPNLTFR